MGKELCNGIRENYEENHALTSNIQLFLCKVASTFLSF